jgi:hypothetical protein
MPQRDTWKEQLHILHVCAYRGVLWWDLCVSGTKLLSCSCSWWMAPWGEVPWPGRDLAVPYPEGTPSPPFHHGLPPPACPQKPKGILGWGLDFVQWFPGSHEGFWTRGNTQIRGKGKVKHLKPVAWHCYFQVVQPCISLLASVRVTLVFSTHLQSTGSCWMMRLWRPCKFCSSFFLLGYSF